MLENKETSIEHEQLFNGEAEQRVLGTLILNNESLSHVIGIINEEDFYYSGHKIIFSAITKLTSKINKLADVVTIKDFIDNHGNSELVSMDYLVDLAQYQAGFGNLKNYTEIIKEKSLLRQLFNIFEETAREIKNPQGKTFKDFLNLTQNKLFDLSDANSRNNKGLISIGEIAQELTPKLKNNDTYSMQDFVGIKSGFIDLDKITSGFQKGDLIVLAARPSMGKTALAINIAENIIFKNEVNESTVAIFSLEMSSSQLALRLIGSLARIDQSKLRQGLNEKDNDFNENFSRLTYTLSDIASHGTQLYIDDTSITLEEIRASIRKLYRERKNVKLIVIDYIQLISTKSENDSSRAVELGNISRGLKLLARELKTTILVLSQLNRSVESRQDKRPMMSDLRDSGAIEQDADIIMFIYRDDYYNSQSQRPNIAELSIAKHRNGPTGIIDLMFHKELTRFENLAISTD